MCLVDGGKVQKGVGLNGTMVERLSKILEFWADPPFQD